MAGFAMGLFAVQTFWGFTMATLPLYLRDLAGSNTLTGILLSTTGIAGIVFPVASGAVSDRISTRWGRRKPVIAAGWTLACCALLAMTAVRSLPAVLGLLVLAYAGFFIALGPYFALLADTFPPEERSAATGVMFLVGGTGILSYLLFAARFYESSPLWPFFWTVGGIVLANSVLFFVIRERAAAVALPRPGGLFGDVLNERTVIRFYAGMLFWWTGLWMVSTFFIIAYREVFGVSIARAVAEGQLSRRHEVMLTADFVYEDLDAVRQRFVAIDIDRGELFDARRDEIGRLFRSGGVATGQGRRFTQVFRLDVLA
mgnify:CR=1 FL=1